MRTVELDSQVLSAMQSCFKYWDLRFLQHWTPNHKKESLEKGDLIHTAFQHYYTGMMMNQEMRKVGAPEVDRAELIHQALEIAREKAVDLETPDEETARIIQIINGYFEYYFTLDGNLEIIAVERPFSKIMYESEEENLRIVYTGITDLTTDSKITNRTVWDHKSIAREYPMDEMTNQFLGYAWAYDTNWVIVNKVGLQKSKKADERYERKVLSVPDYLKERWKYQAIETVRSAIRVFESGNLSKAYKFGSCNLYGGCDFKEICKAPEDMQRDKLMMNFYVGVPWSPYTRDGHSEVKKD